MSLPLFSQPAARRVQAPTDPGLTQDVVDRMPWKYIGSPLHAYLRMLANSAAFNRIPVVQRIPRFRYGFAFFRRFDTLSTRVILALQDRVAEVEASLEAIDNETSRRSDDMINNGSPRDDPRQNQRNLLWEARNRLDDYCRFVTLSSQVRARPPPAERDVASVRMWQRNNDQAIAEPERKYTEKRDLLLVSRIRNPVRQFLERWSPIRRCGFWKEDRPELPFYVQSNAHFYSDRQLERLSSIIATAISLGMFIIPFWVLASLGDPAHKLKIITFFASLCVGILSLGTTAKPHEALAAAATYCAILTGFLQLQKLWE